MDYDDGYNYGWRLDQDNLCVGDNVAPSHVWLDEVWTAEEMQGTCCFKDYNDLARYARHMHGQIIKIKGTYVGSDDSHAGAMMIADAVVVEIVGRQ